MYSNGYFVEAGDIVTNADGIFFEYYGIQRCIDYPGADKLDPETVDRLITEEIDRIEGDWDDGSF